MKTLLEHNELRRQQHASLNSNEPRRNGIACPNCGNELLDSSPMFTLTSNPPQKNIHCANCEYVGYRVA